MKIQQKIQQLITCAISLNLIEEEDEIYARNRILSLLSVNEFVPAEELKLDNELPDLLDEIVAYAAECQVIDDVFDEKEILAAKIMDVFMSKPSEVNHCFYEKYKEDPRSATDYFYTLSQNANYIQTKRIGKNINYKAKTEYGELDITINLSKPEKNPKDIAKGKTIKSTNYPKCLLCIENEGYQGRIGHPARSNHRMVRLNLLGEKWYLQYSPYVYYNEHCIILSQEHRDMKIDRQTLARLLAFVELVPHYFAGSNADLPIVGGSILTHDHYQGGRYEFAMAKARDEYNFKLKKFPDVVGAIVKWPMSVIRLRSLTHDSLLAGANHVLDYWRKYNDPAVNIYAYTGDIPHNTITPIARKRNSLFELDLVLRNNRTSIEHPLGIFHPHQDVQHIKKENIGLIEVMGLAVLPARLKSELQEVEKYLLNHANTMAEYHYDWANQMKEQYKDQVREETVRQIVKHETAVKFLRVLEDAGVFKRDEAGKAAFRRFISLL
ncbi:MAG: Galactose-phosphate uridylyltransferase [Firmicutes bacterium]|nr:Galactose-phosphate uridylyltransferase [Bacillota bacterium]